MLADLPPAYAATRESLRALACFALSPARKARTGRIGLRAHGGGIATPPFDDGTRIALRGVDLEAPTGEVVRVTTVAAAARFLGIEPSSDPGVGHDLPPFEPDADLQIDAEASLALGSWYRFAQQALDRLGETLAAGTELSEAQLWPEHFDLAAVVAMPVSSEQVNVGFSPGDSFHAEPYVYVGPHDLTGLDRSDPYWNAPFGAVLRYGELRQAAEAQAEALRFIAQGLARLGSA